MSSSQLFNGGSSWMPRWQARLADQAGRADLVQSIIAPIDAGRTVPGPDLEDASFAARSATGTLSAASLEPTGSALDPVTPEPQAVPPTISLTTLGSAYTQNFDTLSNTALSTTNTLTIDGWAMTETGGGVRDNEQYGVDTGGSNTGDTYSYGAAGSTDRALGQLRSGTLIPNFGAAFTNNSGATITSLLVSFDGEQWRYGGTHATVAERLDFQISFDATSLTTGTWTDVNALDFSPPVISGSARALDGNADFVSLSSTIGSLSIANGATFWIRWQDVDASGSDDGLAIDNFSITPSGTVPLPNLTITDVTQGETNAGTTTFTLTVNLSAPAGAGGVTFDIATADGTATTADSDYVARTLTSQTIAAGLSTFTFDVTVNGDTAPELNETFFVNVTNVTGANVTDGEGRGTITNDDGGVTLSINNPSVAEGNAGTTILTYTITLSGPAATDVTFDIATADGTATTADADYVARALTGQVITAGTTTFTFDVTVNGDTVFEPNDTVVVNVTNVTGAAVQQSQGIGTITNDDASPLPKISAIQGTAYFSPILTADGIGSFNIASTTTVTVQAVITAVDNTGNRRGFYITEENADWDANSGTSEGIFVMFANDSGTSTLAAGATVPSLATLQVGDLVTVTAKVMEYQTFQNMPVTVLTLASNVLVNSSGNTVPTLVLDAGRPIPNGILTAVTPDYLDSADGAGDTFDASLYALSYFETVESMLVTIPSMRAADGFVTTSGGDPFFQAYSTVHANPQQLNSRGGYTISGDPPLSPPDTATITDDTRNGGQVLHDGDTNPDIIELDFTDFAGPAPAGISNVTMGDAIGDVTGIIGFDFTALKLYVTGIAGFDINAVNAQTPIREVADFSSATDPRQLTVGTFNVENLDPTDGQARFDALAQAILINLKLPDILTIEEIQDNNGAAAGDGISPTGSDASTTWTMLVNAVNAAALASGSTAVYQWVDQAPNYNAEGGEQSGNIRVGFLYNTTRVQLGNLAADATLAERRQFTDRLGDNARDAGDLIQFSDNMVAGINTADYTTTRKSLLGQFTFNGNTIFALANHLPSKGGSGEFWQFNQDLASGEPDNSDWAQRNAIGEDIYSLANLIQTNAPTAGFVAGGDFNDFQFYRPLEAATGYVFANGTARNEGARLTNLTLTLAEAERYTYTFDGRSQAIDHILVNSVLAGTATYDVVHINTGYGRNSAIPLSDHEPAVARFDFRAMSETLNGTPQDDFFRLEQGGNDTVNGGAGNDGFYFGAAYTSADTVDGGAGTLDQIGLQGNYAGGVVLGSLLGTELVVLLPGDDTRFGDAAGNFYDYVVTANAGTQVSNNRLTIQANTLRAGEDFTFNGSASAIDFLIYGGLGVENLTGGSGNDGFFFGQSRFNPTDVVNGGAGTMDQLGLQGDYSGPNSVTFGAGQLTGIEFIVLLSASDNRFGASGGIAAYELTMNDANVGAGQRLIVSANTLAPTEFLAFNGSAETDGSFSIFSGACNDILRGSQNADVIFGGAGFDIIFGNGGGDQLTGGLGDDIFAYSQLTDSASGAADSILDFVLGDTIDLSELAISTNVAGGTFQFIGSGPQTGARQLQVIQTGNSATVNVFVDGDMTVDQVINVTVADGHTLTIGDFDGVSANAGGAQTPAGAKGDAANMLFAREVDDELDFSWLASAGAPEGGPAIVSASVLMMGPDQRDLDLAAIGSRVDDVAGATLASAGDQGAGALLRSALFDGFRAEAEPLPAQLPVDLLHDFHGIGGSHDLTL